MRTTENVERIKRLEAYATNLYINELDHDPVDNGLGQFVEGFIEGVLFIEDVLAQREEDKK
jgi:hypothetical protein